MRKQSRPETELVPAPWQPLPAPAVETAELEMTLVGWLSDERKRAPASFRLSKEQGWLILHALGTARHAAELERVLALWLSDERARAPSTFRLSKEQGWQVLYALSTARCTAALERVVAEQDRLLMRARRALRETKNPREALRILGITDAIERVGDGGKKTVGGTRRPKMERGLMLDLYTRLRWDDRVRAVQLRNAATGAVLALQLDQPTPLPRADALSAVARAADVSVRTAWDRMDGERKRRRAARADRRSAARANDSLPPRP